MFHGVPGDVELGAASGNLCPRPRWDGGQVVQGTLSAGLCPLLAAARLPLLKAHRFSHSLGKDGQEWLSPGSAMGQACASERAAAMEQELSGILASKRGGDCLLQRAARYSSWWDGGAGVPATGPPGLQPGGRPSSSSIPTPSPIIGLLPVLDKTFREELKSCGRSGDSGVLGETRLDSS